MNIIGPGRAVECLNCWAISDTRGSACPSCAGGPLFGLGLPIKPTYAYEGLLTLLGVQTDKPPAVKGHLGHGRRVVIPSRVAANVLHTLIGAPVNCSWDKRGHDLGNVIGAIVSASIVGSELRVIFTTDQPLCCDDLGMSWEGHRAQIKDAAAQVWEIVRMESFTGAAVLKRDNAAWSDTWIRPYHGKAKRETEVLRRVAPGAQSISVSLAAESEYERR